MAAEFGEIRARMMAVAAAALVVVGVASWNGPRADDASGEAPDGAPSELAGTSWRLANIQSMDDTNYTPDDPGRYTLELKADGSASVQADCNLATGSWHSEAAGKLTFGPLATTRAMCPPSSISDRYLAQFPWVRSYVMDRGRLFLATMADGSIIEFEPVRATLVATVLGQEVRTEDAAEMQRVVLGKLFDRYAEEKGIGVSESEIDAYVEHLRRGTSEDPALAEEEDLTPEESAEVDRLRRDMGRSMIRHWKINLTLCGQYGGRIIAQQLGPEPLDAYRRFLEERQAAGDFQIYETGFEDAFWRYFTNDSIHTFLEEDCDSEDGVFETLPWK